MQEQINLENRSLNKENQNMNWFDKIEFVVSTKWFMIILVIVGIAFYIITENALSPQLQQVNNTSQNLAPTGGYRIFLKIINLLCGTSISTGILSLFLRITSMKKSITDTVVETYNNLSKSLLGVDFELNAYSNEVLDKLQDRIVIQKSDAKISSDKLKYSVYSLEKNISSLLTGIYYEYHRAIFLISPDDNNEVFKKTVKLDYKIINSYKLDNIIKISLAFMNKELQSDEDKKNMIKVNLFTINGVDLIKEIPNLINIENIDNDSTDNYDFRLVIRRELKENESHVVKINYEYDVPYWDATQSFKLIHPCKHFEHKIFITDNKDKKNSSDYCNWRLMVNGFSSFFYPNSRLEEKFKVLSHTDKNAEITFNEWVLPGTGYVVYFDEIKSEL